MLPVITPPGRSNELATLRGGDGASMLALLSELLILSTVLLLAGGLESSLLARGIPPEGIRAAAAELGPKKEFRGETIPGLI